MPATARVMDTLALVRLHPTVKLVPQTTAVSAAPIYTIPDRFATKVEPLLWRLDPFDTSVIAHSVQKLHPRDTEVQLQPHAVANGNSRHDAIRVVAPVRRSDSLP